MRIAKGGSRIADKAEGGRHGCSDQVVLEN